VKFLLIIFSALLLTACALTGSEGYYSSDRVIKKSYYGTASWYQSGKKTASGERFDPNKYSVAHRTIPFGTMLRLTNVSNGNTLEVVVNDRGPFVRNKEIDVSRGAAQTLGFFHSGTAKLLIEVLEKR
jgi:rare lipoprotein A